jgi:hypothetical protein
MYAYQIIYRGCALTKMFTMPMCDAQPSEDTFIMPHSHSAFLVHAQSRV